MPGTEGFFRRHIAWILPYYRAIDDVEYRVESLLNELEIEAPEDFDPETRAELAALARDREEDVYVLNRIHDFLNDKRRFVAFALDEDVPYPENFLNLDSAYYETVLDRQGFATYIASLNEPTLLPWTFSEAAL